MTVHARVVIRRVRAISKGFSKVAQSPSTLTHNEA